MANPNTNAELGAEAAAETETPRTPRRTIKEGVLKFLREFGSVLTLGLIARAGSEKGQEAARNLSLFREARNAAMQRQGESPANLAALQRGTEASLRGDELQEAA